MPQGNLLLHEATFGSGFAQSHFFPGCQFLQAVHGGFADLAFGHIDHPQGADGIGRVGDELEIGHHIANFLAVIKVETANHLISDVGPPKGIFQHTGLGVGAVQNRDITLAQGT